MDSLFDGTTESEMALLHRDGKLVFEMVKHIKVAFGKGRQKPKKITADKYFKKQSIFFCYLPYLKELEIGHATDRMHVEKSVFENTIGLLLDIPGKTKDGLSVCKDL